MRVVLIVVAVLVVVAVIVLVMRAFARGIRDLRIAYEQGLMTSGVETTAWVVKVPKPQQGWVRNGGVWGQVTFAYLDQAGVERRVRRSVLIRRQAPVVVGATTRVWFDATAPQDDSRVVVELEQQSRAGR